MPDIPTFDSLQTPASALADAFEREAMLHAGDAWGTVYIASANCIRALLNALDLSTLHSNELFRENAALKTAADGRKEKEEYVGRAAAGHDAPRSERRVDRLVGLLAPCPCCAGTNIHWSDCAGNFVVHSVGSGGPAYGRWVCGDCGLGTTPCPTDRAENAAAQWNARMESRTHPSDYWKAVGVEEQRLLGMQLNG